MDVWFITEIEKKTNVGLSGRVVYPDSCCEEQVEMAWSLVM